MSVYVDDYDVSYRGMKMSHMLADTDEELHAMADLIGVARKHYQGPPKTRTSHYDICKTKKAIALQNGAIQITVREAALMNGVRRKTGKLGSLSEAREYLETRFK